VKKSFAKDAATETADKKKKTDKKKLPKK